MRSILILFGILFSTTLKAQLTGVVLDGGSNEPVPYVNIWIKGTRIGATTNFDGQFLLEGQIGDTVHISHMGFESAEFIAQNENNIVLSPMINQLEEVVVIPMKNTKYYPLESYKKPKKNRRWYNNGHYSLARFNSYSPKYAETPFISSISLITHNTKKENVLLRLRLVYVSDNGEPSETGLTDELYIECKKGTSEILVELENERITFPENGFFVVVDRLNLSRNLDYNKMAKMDILQPAIGIELNEQEPQTWFGYGGRWMPPSQMKEYVSSNENFALNIELTN